MYFFIHHFFHHMRQLSFLVCVPILFSLFDSPSLSFVWLSLHLLALSVSHPPSTAAPSTTQLSLFPFGKHKNLSIFFFCSFICIFSMSILLFGVHLFIAWKFNFWYYLLMTVFIYWYYLFYHYLYEYIVSHVIFRYLIGILSLPFWKTQGKQNFFFNLIFRCCFHALYLYPLLNFLIIFSYTYLIFLSLCITYYVFSFTYLI